MLQLRDIMTTDVHTLAPEATLRDALELFSLHHISGAPVVDNGRVAGVLSGTDVLEFLAARGTSPTLVEEATIDGEWEEGPAWDVDDEPAARFYAELWSRPSGGPADEQLSMPRDRDLLDEHTVEEAMTNRVLSLPPQVDVAVAADRMRTADVHRILVMEDGTLLGLVTTMDLARAVADHRIVRRTWVFDRARGMGRELIRS